MWLIIVGPAVATNRGRADYDAPERLVEMGGMSDLKDLAEAVRSRSLAGVAGRPVRPAWGGVRCGAVILDLMVLCFAYAVLFAVFEITGHLLPRYMHVMVAWAFILIYTSTEVFPGRSPGHWLMDLRITSRDGAPATRVRLAIRWLIKYAFLLFATFWQSLDSWVLAVLPGRTLGPTSLELANRLLDTAQVSTWCAGILTFVGIIGAFLPNRRALHDWLSGTAVFELRDVREEPPSAVKAFEVTLASNED
jgi:uncharacterized RDD family membrane protein YckC